MTYNIVLKEKPLDAGLAIEEINEMLTKINCVEVIPIEIQAEHSSAMGFIGMSTAEKLNFEYNTLENLITDILNDMSLEHDNHEYLYFPDNFTIYMDR